MLKTPKLLLVFILFSFFGYSQNYRLEGVVKDSLNNPLENANLIAKPTDKSQKIKFSITDFKGNYRLELKPIPYEITVTYLGYNPYKFSVNPKKNTIKNLTLSSQSNLLEEVIIDLPVSIKNDTITYRIDKFTSGDERKLKNVLKKLPGIEVEQDGSVLFQGKKITTLLVDNKKFFGGGTKLGVDNIPANVIDNIEVIENYSEIAFMKNLVDSGETAMNINLKEDKKNFVFGDVEAGKGNRNFYRTHANLFYYGKKTTFNLIGNLNNTSDQVLTYKQYFDFQGNVSQIFNKGKTVINNSLNDFMQFVEKEDVIKSNRKFGALNINQEINNKMNISSYGIFSKTKDNALNETINQYNNFTENSNYESINHNDFYVGNIQLSYFPNLKNKVYLKTQIKSTSNNYSEDNKSITPTTNSSFFNQKTANATYFFQTLEWYKKSSNKNTYTFMSNLLLDNSAINKQWLTPDNTLVGFIPISEQENYNLKQFKRTKNLNFENNFNYYKVINKNNHLKTILGNTYIRNKFISQDVQVLDNNLINNINGFNNNLIFKLNDFFIGQYYKFRTGKFTFNQGAMWHFYNWEVDQVSILSKHKNIILPEVSILLEFNKSKKIKLNYNLKSSFSDAVNYTNKNMLTSYNSAYFGNQNLENELYHTLSINYSRFSLFKGLRFYLMGNYIKQVKGFINKIQYQNINQNVSILMLDNPQNRWWFKGNIRKKIGNFKYGFELHYNTSSYKQNVNDNLQNNKNNMFTYKTSISTLYDEFPSVDLEFKQVFGEYLLNDISSKFRADQFIANLDYSFFKGLNVKIDFSLNYYSNKSFNQKNTYNITNSTLFYRKENSPWSFKLESNNIFDIKFKNQYSFSNYVISDSKTYIFPRVFLFSIGYNL